MSVKFSDVKVHNEIELCELGDLETKDKIEQALLKKRISFFVRWRTKGLFARMFSGNQETGILCVNEWQKEEALGIIGELEKNSEIRIKYVDQKVDKIFF